MYMQRTNDVKVGMCTVLCADAKLTAKTTPKMKISKILISHINVSTRPTQGANFSRACCVFVPI